MLVLGSNKEQSSSSSIISEKTSRNVLPMVRLVDEVKTGYAIQKTALSTCSRFQGSKIVLVRLSETCHNFSFFKTN